MIKKVLLVMSFATAVVDASTLDVGLLAHYTFDGNANDSSGNGVSATVVGASLSNGVEGSANSSYYFNGSSYISVQNIPTPTSNSFTWSLWAKTPSPGNYNLIEAASMGDNTLSPYIGVNTQAHYIHFFTYDGTISGSANDANSFDVYSSKIQANGWMMLTVVSSALDNKRTFYINGEESGSYFSTSYGQQVGSLIFGADRFSIQRGDGYLTGYLDNIRIYDRTVSGSEIAMIYVQEVPEPSSFSLLAVGLGGMAMIRRRRS
jgi:hypothetical protein